MRKILTAAVAAATLAGALAMPTAADARRGWRGPAIGAFAAGAIIGGVLAARPYYYYPPAYYGPAPAYYGPGPVYYYAPGPVQYEYYDDGYRTYNPCARRDPRMGPCGS
jgi:hypothetical protein